MYEFTGYIEERSRSTFKTLNRVEVSVFASTPEDAKKKMENLIVYPKDRSYIAVIMTSVREVAQ